MYLSSRFAACVGIAAALAAGTAHAELAGRPAFAGIRPTIVTPRYPHAGIAPTIVGRHDGYPSAGIRPTIVLRARRGYGPRNGYGGYGLGYDGESVSDVGPSGFIAPDAGPIGAPSPFAFRPRPVPCPQIVEIDGGLAHKARTRVVSGLPCGR